MAILEAESVVLSASDVKVEVIAFDLLVFGVDKPAALLGGVREGGKYALWRYRIGALNDECVMNHGLLFDSVHCFLPRDLIKLRLKY
jgi:hypothetical protein